MNTPNIQIAIASTVEYNMPTDSVFVPMFLGAAFHTEDEKAHMSELGFTCDDTLDNISSRNDKYCELTGIYWIWKNSGAEYKGLYHYRRLLGSTKNRKLIAGGDELSKLLLNHKLILPKKRMYYIETLASHYEHTHDGRHLQLVRNVIEKNHPDYLNSYDSTLKRIGGYMFNIMILRSDLLDEYCNWLFPILYETEPLVDETDMNRFDKRYAGRISEILFNVWLDKMLCDGTLTKQDICELPVVYTEGVNIINKAFRFLKAKFFKKKYH